MKGKKRIILIVMVIAIVLLTIAFALMSNNLDIRGTGKVEGEEWKIAFENLGSVKLTGVAEEKTAPTIKADTEIGDYEVILKRPGDNVTYNFDVHNKGKTNAQIETLIVGEPECTGLATDDEQKLADAQIVKGSLKYVLTYAETGEQVAEGDMLNAGEVKKLTLKLSFEGDKLPSSEVQIGGLGISIIYTQITTGEDDLLDRSELKVGDYVDYKYDTVSEAYSVETSVSGATSKQTISQITGLKWRIYKIYEDGTIELISAIPTTQTIGFSGARAYNNSVYIINDICKEQYSNKSLGIYARSLTIEDVEEKLNANGIAARNSYTSEAGIKYGKTKTYTGNASYYPNLYSQENGSGINTTIVKTNGIGSSDKYYSQLTTETLSQATTSGLTVTQTYYGLGSALIAYFEDSNVYNMLFESTDSYYWLASRCNYCYLNCNGFCIQAINNVAINGHDVFQSLNFAPNPYPIFALRPIVSIASDIQITICEGENSSTNMHKIK